MFRMFADDLCFYDDKNPDDSFKLLSPHLQLSDNSAGSLTFTLPPSNVAYDLIERLSTYIYIYRDDEEIWSGRAIDEQKDFWNNRAITCEGRLSFLNDTIQPTWTYSDSSGGSLDGLMQHFLTVHNAQMDQSVSVNASKRFSVGIISDSLKLRWLRLIGGEPVDSELIKTDYDNTFECFRSKIIEPLGGHLFVVKRDGEYKLDYLDDSDLPNVTTQKIYFGSNLSEFTQNYDMTSLVTAVIPLGARLSEIDESSNSDERLTIDSGQVCADQEIIDRYGYIAKVVEWSDVKDKARLEQLATEYLASVQLDSIVLEISAVDLHYIDPNIGALNLLDRVQFISKPHGFNPEDARVLTITDIDISLDDPSNTKYTLGKTETRSLSDAGASSNRNSKTQLSDVSSWVSKLITDRSNAILSEARRDAGELMDRRANGYVTFALDSTGCPEEIYIANNKDYRVADRYWRWNVNGLAYYDRATMSEPKTAWAMDGGFCADFITTGAIDAGLITTGYLSADIIRSGIITSNNFDGTFDHWGYLITQPTNTGSYFSLSTGYLGVYAPPMGADISGGRFRTLWNGSELGGFGTISNGQGGGNAYLFFNSSVSNNKLIIGYGESPTSTPTPVIECTTDSVKIHKTLTDGWGNSYLQTSDLWSELASGSGQDVLFRKVQLGSSSKHISEASGHNGIEIASDNSSDYVWFTFANNTGVRISVAGIEVYYNGQWRFLVPPSA